MTETITVVNSGTRPVRTRRLQRAGTLVAASVVAMLVWTVSVPILGIDLVAGSGPSAQTVGPVGVAVVPLVAGGVAWMLLALLEKAGTAGRRVWLVLGLVFLAVSLAGPLTMATSAGVMVSLLAMHLLVGATLIVGLSTAAKNA